MAVLLSLFLGCQAVPLQKIISCGKEIKACHARLTPTQKASKVLAYEACKQHFE